MTRTSVALALASFMTSASAQDYNRQDLVRGLCQKDGCDEFTILAADRMKTTEEGTLFKTRLKTFHASHAGRQDRGEENGYVYCSPTRPAIMAEQNGQTMAFFLAPFATQESRESVRQNANSMPFTSRSAMAGRPGRRQSITLPRWLRAMATGWRSPNPS